MKRSRESDVELIEALREDLAQRLVALDLETTQAGAGPKESERLTRVRAILDSCFALIQDIASDIEGTLSGQASPREVVARICRDAETRLGAPCALRSTTSRANAWRISDAIAVGLLSEALDALRAEAAVREVTVEWGARETGVSWRLDVGGVAEGAATWRLLSEVSNKAGALAGTSATLKGGGVLATLEVFVPQQTTGR